MKRVCVFLLLLSCVALLSAASPQDDVANKLVGAWRLVSVENTDATFHFVFDHPTGLIVYDRSGWMSVQIDVKGTRKPFANGAAGGTGEEKISAFDNYVAYYGTYTVDLKAQTVTHHLADSTVPNWRGVNNVRWFQFQDNDHLLLAPAKTGKAECSTERMRPISYCGSASNRALPFSSLRWHRRTAGEAIRAASTSAWNYFALN